MSACPEGGCGVLCVYRDNVFGGIHPGNTVPDFRIPGFPSWSLDLCITDLPWLSVQTSLEPCDFQVCSLPFICVCLSITGDDNLLTSYHRGSLVLTLKLLCLVNLLQIVKR